MSAMYNRYFLLVLFLLSITSCGGGGGSSQSENGSSPEPLITIERTSLTMLDSGESGFPRESDVEINDIGQAYALWNDCFSFRKIAYYDSEVWQDPIILSLSGTADLSCDTSANDMVTVNDMGDAAAIWDSSDTEDKFKITYLSEGVPQYTVEIPGIFDFVGEFDISSNHAVINNDGLVYALYTDENVYDEAETTGIGCSVHKLAILDRNGIVKIDSLNGRSRPCDTFVGIGLYRFITLDPYQEPVILGSTYGLTAYSGLESYYTYEFPLPHFFPEENFLFMYSQTEGYLQRFQANVEKITHISPSGPVDIELPPELILSLGNYTSMTVTDDAVIYLTKAIICPKEEFAICDGIGSEDNYEGIIASWAYKNGAWSEPILIQRGFGIGLFGNNTMKTKTIYIRDNLALIAYGENKNLNWGCVFNGERCITSFSIDAPRGVIDPAFDMNSEGVLINVGAIGSNTNLHVSLHKISLPTN